MVTHRLDDLQRPSKEFPRSFVPENLNFSEWPQLEALFKKLESEDLSTVEKIELWLKDWSELQAVLYEESARRYIAMSCATEDEQKEKAFLHFVEEISPKTKPYQDSLARKLLNAPAAKSLSSKYELMLRSYRNSVELYREENISIETELDKLSQQFQKITGSMTVQFRGEEKTLQQMTLLQEEKDRDLRKESWELIWNRRLAEKDKLEDIFDKMIELRTQVAKNAGFENFRDYQFRRNERFDYTPQDCFDFHQAVEACVVPLLRQLFEQRRKSLGVESLKPWDVACDKLGRDPLKPYNSTDELVKGCYEIFSRVDSDLGGKFKAMSDLKLLDLDSRKGKAPGGYQEDLTEIRLPFIFMNAVGSNDDVFTLLHEGGHAFHSLLSRNQDLFAFRRVPIEFAEVASMGMEQLASVYLDTFYDKSDTARARLENMTETITLLPWIATIDEFQHWIYTNPTHTRSQRKEKWLSIRAKYYPVVDYSGYEEANAYRWQAQLHLFEHAFYYIEYGIAQLGALQLWLNANHDFAGAVKAYKHALSLGGTKKLPELFEAANLKFDFSKRTIEPLMKAIESEVNKLTHLEIA